MPRAPRTNDLLLRSQLVAPVLAYVRARGGDARGLAEAFSLPAGAESAPEVRLPLSSLQGFFEAAEREARDPFLGLHVAAAYRPGTWDVIEYAAKSAPTLREALDRVARYAALFNEHVVVSFEERGGEGVVAQRIPGRGLCLGRHGNEFFACAVLAGLRSLTGAAIAPTRAFFAHPAPPDRSELHALFGPRLEFGAERNGFALPSEVLAAPLPSSEPGLLALLDRYAARALAERGEAPGRGRLLGQVSQGVRQALLQGEAPGLADVARALRLSDRTLQRRLAAEGTTFVALVDQVRSELARAYVADPGRPLGEVAFLLGYAELAPFVRAFRRWTGKTPAAFRASLRAGEGRAQGGQTKVTFDRPPP